MHDPGGHIDRLAGFVQRRSLFPRLVRPMLVVMLRVPGQNPLEVPFAVDQDVVEALAPQRSQYRSAIKFAWGDRAGILMTRAPSPASTSSKAAVNLLSRAGDLAAQDGDLMPEHQDFHVLGNIAAGEERQPVEQPDHEQIGEAEGHEDRG
jgi:hypothetical protein